MKVHLVDGTYELFRHYYGRPARRGADGGEVGAVTGLVRDTISMLESGVTHLGVATDHVIESFRNDMWPGYKSSAGVPGEILVQFPLLEEALSALGVKVWPMVELEADDALASAAACVAKDGTVDQVIVCTPDKDLAQCVSGERVVQLDRRTGEVRGEAGVWDKFGVAPSSIPDWLALVGDSADGFPGLSGWGKRSASVVLAHYGHIERIPAESRDWDAAVLESVRGAPKLAARLEVDMELALLFRDLATLRVDESLVSGASELAWRGPGAEFDVMCELLREPELCDRACAVATR